MIWGAVDLIQVLGFLWLIDANYPFYVNTVLSTFDLTMLPNLYQEIVVKMLGYEISG